MSEGAAAFQQRLADALRNLGLAAKSLQFYPAGSRVVQDALQQAFATLQPLLTGGVLMLDVTPKSFRSGEDDLGDGHPVIEQFARRLHRHGIARLAFDSDVDPGSLEQFIALIALDRRDLDAAGGLEQALRERSPAGIHTQLLELERLFADSEGDADAEGDIWDSLLRDFSDEVGGGPLDWPALVGDAERLEEFVDWFGEHLDEISERMGYEQVEVLRNVLERMAQASAELGSTNISKLVAALRRLVEALEPGVLAELLADPLEIELGADPDADDTSPDLSVEEYLAGVDVTRDADGSVHKTLDVTRVIAQGLTTEQTENLIFHTVSATAQSSPRLYRLFERVLDGRQDRDAISREVRASLERSMTESADPADPASFLAHWPKLTQVLDGEAPDRFVRSDYGASLRALLGAEPQSRAWDADLVRARLTEMKHEFVLRKKAQVLTRVLDIETDDEFYIAYAARVEQALNELLASDEYKEVKQIFEVLVRHVQGDDRSDAKKRCADGIIERFCRPETLRRLVRASLGGEEAVIDLIVEIVRIRGKEVAAVLLDTVADEETSHVRQRLQKFAPLLGDAIVAGAVERLDDERGRSLRNLALILGELGGDEVVSQLGTLLRSSDEKVRRQAAEALIRIGTKAAEAPLVAAIEDEDDLVRFIAIHGLGYVATSAGIARLQELLRLSNLRGRNTTIIAIAAIALGRLKDPKSRAELKRLSRMRIFFPRRRRPARDAASWALEAIDGRRPGPAPEPPSIAQIVPRRARRRHARKG